MGLGIEGLIHPSPSSPQCPSQELCEVGPTSISTEVATSVYFMASGSENLKPPTPPRLGLHLSSNRSLPFLSPETLPWGLSELVVRHQEPCVLSISSEGSLLLTAFKLTLALLGALLDLPPLVSCHQTPLTSPPSGKHRCHALPGPLPFSP